MLAEELGHYWQTSKTSPDTWLDKAEVLVEGHGGTVLSRGYGKSEGREAYMLAFKLEGQAYKIVAGLGQQAKQGGGSGARSDVAVP